MDGTKKLKMLLSTVLLIGASYIGCTSAKSISSTVNAIEAIPENDRSDFIFYELFNVANAANRNDIWFKKIDCDLNVLNQTLHEKFAKTKIDDDFPIKLLEWVEDEIEMGTFPLNNDGYNNSVCFPSGCVDPGDIGSVCCPF